MTNHLRYFKDKRMHLKSHKGTPCRCARGALLRKVDILTKDYYTLNNMKQKKINFAQLLKNYSTGWVGISSTFDSVVLHGKTLKEVTKKADKLKEKVFFFPAGQAYSEFIG